MNSITITGRVSGDPEVRYYDSGAVRATFHLLVGIGNDQPDRFLVEAWGKQAHIAADWIRNDRLVGVVGSLLRQGPDNVTPGDVYVRVDRLELLRAADRASF